MSVLEKVELVKATLPEDQWLEFLMPFSLYHGRWEELLSGEGERMVDWPMTVGGKEYVVTCVNVGNPHCVVFCDGIDGLDLEDIGPKFEHAPLFPERINTEFVRVVTPTTLRMRVWERGNGETLACGTGACAAVIAAAEKGLCPLNTDVTVKLLGGDLTVNYTGERVTLTGSAVEVFEGEFEY